VFCETHQDTTFLVGYQVVDKRWWFRHWSRDGNHGNHMGQ